MTEQGSRKVEENQGGENLTFMVLLIQLTKHIYEKIFEKVLLPKSGREYGL